jgi:hypothetical protein
MVGAATCNATSENTIIIEANLCLECNDPTKYNDEKLIAANNENQIRSLDPCWRK